MVHSVLVANFASELQYLCVSIIPKDLKSSSKKWRDVTFMYRHLWMRKSFEIAALCMTWSLCSFFLIRASMKWWLFWYLWNKCSIHALWEHLFQNMFALFFCHLQINMEPCHWVNSDKAYVKIISKWKKL